MPSDDWELALLAAATVPWMRNDNGPHGVIDKIHDQLTEFAATAQRMFRSDIVPDAITGRMEVPNAGQQLVRWTDQAPDVVFQNGFQLRSPVDNLDNDGPFELEKYVQLNQAPTVFVSTTQPQGNVGEVHVWTPLILPKYSYDIFAHGGIDVNHVMPVNKASGLRAELEIAFPGGIRPELIRLAREWRRGKVHAIWWNNRFNPNTNPDTHQPSLSQLPRLKFSKRIPQHRLPVPVLILRPQTTGSQSSPHATKPNTNYTASSVIPPASSFASLHINLEADPVIMPVEQNVNPNPSSPPPADLGEREADSDPMEQPGKWVKDPLYGTVPAIRNQIAAVVDPSDSSNVWFFCANCYATIRVPSSSDKLERSQVCPIFQSWPSLWEADFAGGVDALLPEPNNKEEMHVFSGEMTVKIHTASKSTIKGPSNIIDEWRSLKEAGFTEIDAILPNPANQNEAWFFKDEDFIRVGWQSGVTNDRLLDGPTPITKGWKSLKAAGFETVDTFVPNAEYPDQPWVFSGDKYARISISADTMLSEPALISKSWALLREAGFYT